MWPDIATSWVGRPWVEALAGLWPTLGRLVVDFGLTWGRLWADLSLRPTSGRLGAAAAAVSHLVLAPRKVLLLLGSL